MKQHIGGLGVLIVLFVISFYPLKADADDRQGRRISVSDRFLVSRDFERVSGQKQFAPWVHHDQQTRALHFGRHQGFTNIIIVNPPPVVIAAPTIWVPPQWVWNGWQWVWMPGYWTW
jgi:hypothetical protein